MSSMKLDFNIFPAVGAVSFTGFLRWSYWAAGVMLNSTVSAFKDAFSWFFFFILDAGVPPCPFQVLIKWLLISSEITLYLKREQNRRYFTSHKT